VSPEMLAITVIFKSNCSKLAITHWAKIHPIWSPSKQTTNLQRHEYLAYVLCFESKIFSSTLKNALVYYNAGVVAVK
jgi:hypothetical protein